MNTLSRRICLFLIGKIHSRFIDRGGLMNVVVRRRQKLSFLGDLMNLL